ncbi:hypothetical protein LWI28_016255 [Acer negundo]|uniref:Leucine-rich repeat-containing N-terminal plant-type domain-containing protein n=1 Tax=Acer negundo TaxID=4023 RepID=A0AAD5NY86_ACENE|nr:hypothetical protein LWI28_016255 [Acer negundo]
MKPADMSVFVGLVLLQLLAIATINIIGFCNGSAYVDCIECEKQALLRFKEDLTDPSNRLASWNDDRDCCTWASVVCSNFTGHVSVLRLGNPYIDFLFSLFDHERSA